ncbi:glycosyltransferase family 1 protein [Tessaracoccus sp. MC1679]|uniref:glycosyltransferase n=1 Tax=Tessaracoccus sp. MC1679 TaxID=2760313 RepID=UPI0016025FAD|nr:glycosyltransferase [Tessaracoccus sp. MC1679]MBB1514888.1 glycosyltransferase family 1 protein [Tessaracoccus sp. MC1679]
MAVVLIGLGSRGDVQPMAVLGGELARRGVEARVVALAEYADLAGRYGAEAVPIRADLTSALETARRYPLVAGTAFGQGWLLRRWVSEVAGPVADAVLAAARPGDSLLSGILGAGAAVAAAEGLGGRAATVLFTAQLPTVYRDSHCFASWFGPWDAYNRWGTGLSWSVAASLGAPLAAEVRRRVGRRGRRGPGAEPKTGLRGRLGALARYEPVVAALDRHPVLVAASPTLAPPPPDLRPTAHQTGYLNPPDEDAPLSEDLTAFLAAGDPPVFVGAGSLASTTGDRGLAILAEAARLSGRRIVTLAPTAAHVGSRDGQVYAVSDVPFEALFPHTAGVIHHGGAGSTHTGLRSGRPSVAVPFGVDQPYHGARLAALGVGPSPVPFRHLDAGRLARLIHDLVEGPDAARYRERAREVAATIRGEDGVGATIEVMARLGLITA